MTDGMPALAERTAPPGSGPADPKLAVIVPVYNSADDLERCLAGLASSTFSGFEVLVVDDGSTVPIEPIVRRRGYRYMRIEGPGGPARARNRGVAGVSADYVVFVDADVVVHPDTLARMSDRFRSDTSIDAIVGTYDDQPGHPGFLSQYKNIFHHYVHQSAHGEISTFWSGCGAMRRSVFLAFGGFDEIRYRRPAIEDIELGTWVSAAGHRIVLDSTVRCKHLKRWTLKSLLKTDIFDRGVPWTRLMLRARDLPDTLNVSNSQRISVVLAYLTLSCLLAAAMWPVLGWASAGLALGVTLLNLDFYAYFLRRKGFFFTLAVVPLHWLYFFYCGFAFGWGMLLHHWQGDGDKTPPASAGGKRSSPSSPPAMIPDGREP